MIIKTIKRGYSQKVNLGNYQTADYWSEYEAHIEKDDVVTDVARDLHELARIDVQEEIEVDAPKKTEDTDAINGLLQEKPKRKYAASSKNETVQKQHEDFAVDENAITDEYDALSK